MNVLTFQSAFEGFSDLSTDQPYDDPEQAQALLDHIKESYQPWFDPAGGGAGGIVAGPNDRDALAGFAKTLAEEIDLAVRDLMAGLVPSEDMTANVDFQIEDIDGRLATFDAVMEFLQSPNEQATPAHKFRIANHTLEQNIQAVLDHLTARRIAEEMDAPTYVERLRGAFKRVHDGSLMQADKLDETSTLTQRAAHRLGIASELASFASDALEQAGAKDGPAKSTVALLENSKAYTEHLQRFFQIGIASLRDLHSRFCAEGNRAGVEGESILVSRETERHAFFRPLPIIWALTNTVLVKIVLAHNTSETLHYQAVPILTLTFILTWILSIYFGIWSRSRRMKKLKDYTRAQLREILHANAAEQDDVGFPSIGADWVATERAHLTAFEFRGKAAKNTRRIAVYNLWALIIPALLAAVVLITRKEVEHDFIARFPQSEACVLASGHLVFATKASYFVQPSDDYKGIGTWLLNRILPELNAEVVDRTNVISIRKFITDDKDAKNITPHANAEDGIAEQSLLKVGIASQRLRDCAATDPAHNKYTLTHRGNALGALGTQASVKHLSGQIDRLVQAIKASDLINIEWDSRLSSGQGPSTVVTPIINEIIATDASIAVPASQSFFQTTIGIVGNDTSVDTMANALILPFFSTPVQNKPNTIDTPVEAFLWGADIANLNDPVILGPDLTYFNRIANTLESCLVDGGSVELDVIGLASRSWVGPTSIYSPDMLNYYLAEGRRLGALRALAAFIDGPNQKTRVTVKTAGGNSVTLQDMLAGASKPGFTNQFLASFARFEKQKSFQKHRDELIAVTALDPSETSPLEELFGRSVVLKMVSAKGGPCRF